MINTEDPFMIQYRHTISPIYLAFTFIILSRATLTSCSDIASKALVASSAKKIFFW